MANAMVNMGAVGASDDSGFDWSSWLPSGSDLLDAYNNKQASENALKMAVAQGQSAAQVAALHSQLQQDKLTYQTLAAQRTQKMVIVGAGTVLGLGVLWAAVSIKTSKKGGTRRRRR